LAFLLILAGTSAAWAQTADLTRATCAQLMDLPRNDRGQIIVWLHGYYAGAAQRAMLDRTKLEEAFASIQQLCERNRAMPLIGSEARTLFLGEPAVAAPSLPAAPSSGASATSPNPSTAGPIR
jgi:HdeA/HdeB family